MVGFEPITVNNWTDSCDFCDSQEGNHYCLYHSITLKNMDTIKCKQWNNEEEDKKKKEMRHKYV